MKALILRGIPGAGKTHLLREGINHKNVFAVSADDYFIHYDSTVMREVYKFDRAKAGEAHAECFRRYLDAVSSYPTGAKERPQKLIVVSNTNIKSYEIAPYMLAAQAYTIDAAIFTILTEPEVCIQRNVPSSGRQTGPILGPGFRHVSAGFIKRTPIADGGFNGHVPTDPVYVTPPIQFLFVAP
ncbi:MAG: ATP-binding protein [Chloroflexi bacterium]|nr:ATP-binding protein [Chloroflexota bacterium]